MSQLQIWRPEQAELDKLPQLTVLLQQEFPTDETPYWMATCCELGLVGRGETDDEAREALHAEVAEFLANASETEIRERLANGYTPQIEPLKIRFVAESGKVKRRIGQLMTGAVQTTRGAGGAVSRSGTALVHKAGDAREVIGGVVGKARDKAADAGTSITRRTYPLLAGFTEFAGNTVEPLAKNATLRRVAKHFKLEHFFDAIAKVDTDKAQKYVLDLKKQHPTETPRQLAHRLMMQKAAYAGGVGLATKLSPLSVLPLFAVDLAATTLIQAELVYQIAAAYDLDLQDPARKGELLAVFGCVLGTSRAVKAGLTVLEFAPIAGAVIGASSNAVMIYALGHAAARFYEEKLHLQISPASIERVKQENAAFLLDATAQETIADQILVHLLIAGHPEANLEQLRTVVEAANLSPASKQAIGTNLSSLPPLDSLLKQLQPDFAVYLLSQCHQIAQMDGTLTPQEKETLQKIAHHFKIDFEANS